MPRRPDRGLQGAAAPGASGDPGASSGARDKGLGRGGAGGRGRVLIVAGSDSGGGAGIQADIKTVTALGGYAATAVTALTAQNTRGVSGIHEVPADFVARQIADVLDDIGADCIKVGMLHRPDVVEAVCDALAPALAAGVPLVVDPVMVAKGGHPLLDPAAIATLRARLVPLATILTPNLPEAAVLVRAGPGRDGPEADGSGEEGRGGTRSEETPLAERVSGDGYPGDGETVGHDPADAAGTNIEPELLVARVLALGPMAVLLKGGHGEGPVLIDLLAERGREPERFESPRIATRHTHGTGCTLVSAIACTLAQGLPIRAAVVRARAYTRAAIEAAPGLGTGHGPLGHGHTVRPFFPEGSASRGS